MAASKLYKVLVGAVGVLRDGGLAAYHHLGDLVELAEADAERLLGLGVVAPASEDDKASDDDKADAASEDASEDKAPRRSRSTK